MFELILIFAVALLVLPLIELGCIVPPATDLAARRARFLKIIVIVITLVWLVFLLFYPAVALPHVTWAR